MADIDTALLAARLETLHGDVAEIKSAMNELAQAIMKLALIEERLAVSSRTQERAFLAIGKLEDRMSAMEIKSPVNEKTTVWVDRGVMAIVGAAAMFIWDKLKG